MSRKYVPALDGLRTVAVYLVLAFHCAVPAAAGGFVGVDLFFVLSGFLVSSILLEELAATGRLRLGRFYARRVRRLLPAAVAVVVATSAVFLLLFPTSRRLPLVGDAQSALLYVANWRFLLQSNAYFGADVDKSPFLHFWSLAIEEQFYFVFPVLLLLLHRVGRRWGRATVVGVAGLFLASLAAQLYWARIDVNHAYYGTDARLYQLLIGVLGALLVRSGRLRLPARTVGVLTAGALAALLVLGSGLLDVSPSWRGIGAALVSVVVVVGIAVHEPGRVAGLLSGEVITFLGRISYGIYLWHWPVVLAVDELLDVPSYVRLVLVAAVSTGLAAASYEVLEMPVRRTRRLHRFEWSTLVVGVSVSALVAAIVVPPLLSRDRAPALAAHGTAATVTSTRADRPVPRGIDWARIDGDHGTPEGYCTMDDIESCVLHKGSGPHVVLVGDSHARMLGPAFKRLAEEHDFTLSKSILGACPWQKGLVNLQHSPPDRKECVQVRKEFYDRLVEKMDADVVVLTQLPRDSGDWATQLAATDGSKETLAQRTLRTTDETLDALERAGVRVLVVEAMLVTGGIEPLDCLSAARRVSECRVTVPLGQPPSDGYYRTAAVRRPDVFTVNINGIMCPTAPVCEPLMGRLPVWRDNLHFSPAAVVRHRDEIWDAIDATGLWADTRAAAAVPHAD